MMERGDPYMMMENIAAAKPQKSFLVFPCRANRDTTTTPENTATTNEKRPRIFAFSFLGANTTKMKTYTISIAAPVPLIIDTRMLCGDTKGKPYLCIVEYNQKNQKLSFLRLNSLLQNMQRHE